MIVHVFPKEKFTKPYVNFINEMYDLNQHSFILYGNYVDETFDIETYPNVSCFITKKEVLRSKEVKMLLKKASMVILHAYTDLVTSLVILYPFVAKKAAVVFWGADIYAHRDVLDHKVSLRVLFLDYLKGVGLRKCAMFLTFAHDDFRLAKEWFGINGKHLDILYPSTVDKDNVERIYNLKPQNTCIKVVIGNSATKTNQHLGAFDLLKHFSNENIEVYVPLSYGDMDYRDEVIQEGIRIFGEKFHAITEFMTPEEYSEFLCKMDVAVFYNDRQQATGNIELLAYFGAKMFLRSDTVMWTYYVEEEKRLFFDADKISDMSFDEFTDYEENMKEDNHNYFSSIWDKNNLKSIWSNVFDYMELKNGKK